MQITVVRRSLMTLHGVESPAEALALLERFGKDTEGKSYRFENVTITFDRAESVEIILPDRLDT